MNHAREALVLLPHQFWAMKLDVMNFIEYLSVNNIHAIVLRAQMATHEKHAWCTVCHCLKYFEHISMLLFC